MAVFPGTPSEPGCIGALAMGPTYKPSMDGARVYFHTEDTEGNRIALHSPKKE
jgi:predicted enzyme related to lactoylglutathione lyase